MIRWLDDERLPAAVKANMARFKATSFAKDLDESAAHWRFMSWPRSEDTPLRFLLRSDDQRQATFTVDEGGQEYGKLEGAAQGVSPNEVH
jgi:hypothetical protein